jgi:hypothetical protein
MYRDTTLSRSFELRPSVPMPAESKHDIQVLAADTVTRLGPEHRGQVVIAASHGGLYAAYLAARAGLRGVILNDAGVGKDQAGIAGLAYLDDLGLPAATVSHTTARIGDGEHQAARGRVSFVNRCARDLGCAPKQAALDCAHVMTRGEPPSSDSPAYGESRFLLRANPGEPEVWGLDSVALVEPEDAGRILVTASHGALLGGRPDGLVAAEVAGIVLNDAGVGIGGAGITRLAALDERAIPAATVAAESACIGSARSSYEDGLLSHVNATAQRLGAAPGMTTEDFVELLIAKALRRVE